MTLSQIASSTAFSTSSTHLQRPPEHEHWLDKVPTSVMQTALMQARAASSGDSIEMLPLAGPGGMVVDVISRPSKDEVQQLDESIAARLLAITKPKSRNDPHMIEFINIMRGFKPADAQKLREAVLNRAVPHFIQAYFETLQEVNEPQDVAGRYIGMHNWLPEGKNLAVTTTVFLLNLATVLTKDDAPGKRFPPIVAPAVGLAVNLLVMYSNAVMAARHIQPVLTMGRATRMLNPTRAGGAVDIDTARDGLRAAHTMARRVLGPGAAAGDHPQQLEESARTSRDALSIYDENQGTLSQRGALYGPENRVRAFKAGLVNLGTIAALFSNDKSAAGFIPIVLAFQALSYLSSWVANYIWAGPKRDHLLRDGALKIDFAKDGFPHAERLAGAGDTITQIPPDDPVWTWGRSIFKNQKEMRLDMLQTRVQEKIEDALFRMSEPLGIPHADLLDWHSFPLKEELTPEEGEKLQATQVRFAQAEAGLLPGVASTYETFRREYQGWTEERATLKQVQDAAGKDEDSDAWKNLSIQTKGWLDEHLSPNLDLGAIQTYKEFMTQGLKSKHGLIRFSHEVADVTRRDWRLYTPDTFLKLGRAFPEFGFGGSLAPLLKSNILGIVKATSGKEIPDWANVVISVGLFALYLRENHKQGVAVNATIGQKNENKKLAPSKHDDVSVKMAYLKKFFVNMWLMPIDAAQGFTGANERRLVANDIAAIDRARPAQNPLQPSTQGVGAAR